jgi:hypothetical protein
LRKKGNALFAFPLVGSNISFRERFERGAGKTFSKVFPAKQPD